MTQVDFYVLDGSPPGGRELFACRLAEKIRGLGHRIYIHTESAARAAQLDEQLWTFSAGSFVPHALHDAAHPGVAEPVLIGHGADPGGDAEVLINLAETVPPFFSRFLRVAELVDGGEQGRQRARERFRFYKERGYPLASHNITMSGGQS